MNRSLVVGLVVGLGLGVGITSLVFVANRPAAPTSAPARIETASAKSVAPEPVRETPEPAAAPETPPSAPAKAESAPSPTAKPAFDFKTSFAALSKKGLAGYRSKEMGELTDTVKASGTNGVRMVIE